MHNGAPDAMVITWPHYTEIILGLEISHSFPATSCTIDHPRFISIHQKSMCLEPLPKQVHSVISLRYTSHFYIGPASTMITVFFLHVSVQSEQPLEKTAVKVIRLPYLKSANHIYVSVNLK